MNNEIQNLINEKNALNNTIRLRRERHNQEIERLRQEYFFYNNRGNTYRSNSVLNNEIEAQNRAFEDGLRQEFAQELQERNNKLNEERARLTELLATRTQEYNNLISRSFRNSSYTQAPMVAPEGLQNEIAEIQSDLNAINESLNTNGIELNGVKPQAKVEQRQQAPVQTEPVQAEPTQTAPAQTEPAQIEPAQAEQAQKWPWEQDEGTIPTWSLPQDDVIQQAPAQAEPVQTEPAQTEPVQTEPIQTESVQNEPVQAEPVQTELAQAEPVQTEPAQEEPVQTEPAQTEPVQTEPAQTEQAQQGTLQYGKPKIMISKFLDIDVDGNIKNNGVVDYSKLDERLTSMFRQKGFDDNAINNMMETLNTYQGDKNVLIALLSASRSDAESVKYCDDYLSVLKGEKNELSTFDLEYDLSQRESFNKKEFKTIKKYALNSSKFAKIRGIKLLKLRLASRKIANAITRLFRRKDKNTPLLTDGEQRTNGTHTEGRTPISDSVQQVEPTHESTLDTWELEHQGSESQTHRQNEEIELSSAEEPEQDGEER